MRGLSTTVRYFSLPRPTFRRAAVSAVGKMAGFRNIMVQLKVLMSPRLAEESLSSFNAALEPFFHRRDLFHLDKPLLRDMQRHTHTSEVPCSSVLRDVALRRSRCQPRLVGEVDGSPLHHHCRLSRECRDDMQ